MAKERRVSKLNEKLKLKDFKLQSLLEITKAINNNLAVEELISIYDNILNVQLGISQMVLYMRSGDKWICKLDYNPKGKTKDLSIEKELIHLREITVKEGSVFNEHNSDIVIPVYHKDVPLAYLLIGDLDDNEIRISPTIRHMPFIQTLTNIIVVAIENKRLAKENIRQERLKKELEVASEMQGMLLPSSLPSNEIVDVAAKYQAHHKVGGDYYDFIKLNEEEFVFCMADVSGKGVSAALLMSNFQANLRAIIKYNDYSLKKVITDLNQTLMSNAKGEKFITFFIGKYNTNTRKLNYINAGHNHPIMTNGKDSQMLNIGTIGLGMFEELPFIQEDEVTVAPNSIILCYTDGIVELENNQNEPFEVENLLEIIQRNYEVDMNEMIQIIFNDLDTYKEDQSYFDDTALLACRIF